MRTRIWTLYFFCFLCGFGNANTGVVAITTLSKCILHLGLLESKAGEADVNRVLFRESWDELVTKTAKWSTQDYAAESVAAMEAGKLQILFEGNIITEAVAEELKLKHNIQSPEAIRYALKNFRSKFSKQEQLAFIENVTARIDARVPSTESFPAVNDLVAFQKKTKVSDEELSAFMDGWQRSAHHDHTPLKLALYLNFLQETDEFAAAVEKAQRPGALTSVRAWAAGIFKKPPSLFLHTPQLLSDSHTTPGLAAADSKLTGLPLAKKQIFVKFDPSRQLHFVEVPVSSGQAQRIFIPKSYLSKEGLPTVEWMRALNLVTFDMNALSYEFNSVKGYFKRMRIFRDALSNASRSDLASLAESQGGAYSEITRSMESQFMMNSLSPFDSPSMRLNTVLYRLNIIQQETMAVNKAMGNSITPTEK